MSEFEDLIGPLLKREAGYSDRKNDRGGATNYGITQKTLDYWNTTSPHKFAGSIKDVRNLTTSVATVIYWELYWNVAGCQRVPPRVREIHFDAAVQHSPRRAVMLLQQAAGAKVDGNFGAYTDTAVGGMIPDLLFYRYKSFRYEFYGDIIARDPTQDANIDGWMRRMKGLT